MQAYYNFVTASFTAMHHLLAISSKFTDNEWHNFCGRDQFLGKMVNSIISRYHEMNSLDRTEAITARKNADFSGMQSNFLFLCLQNSEVSCSCMIGWKNSTVTSLVHIWFPNFSDSVLKWSVARRIWKDWWHYYHDVT